MQVPLFDLKEQYRQLEPEVLEALKNFLPKQQLILGPAVEQFEKSIASYCGAPYAVGLSSGTDALLVALEALNVGPGDEVIVPAFTFYCTASVVVRRGATPVFADVDLDSFNITVPEAITAVTPRTRAMIPVHLFGQAADLAPLLDQAKKSNFNIIEDSAQAVGAEWQGRRVGSIGRFGAFSFFPTKNLGAFGDGGCLTMQTAEDYEKVKTLRMHGSSKRYYHEEIGGCFRLDGLQAIILEIKLKYLEGWHAARKRNADFYRSRLAGIGDLILPVELPQRRHVYNQFVIRTQKRDALKEFMAQRGIGSEIYYPLALPLQESFAKFGFKPGQFPRSEQASREVLALPIYPELTEAHLAAVCDGIRAFFGS